MDNEKRKLWEEVSIGIADKFYNGVSCMGNFNGYDYLLIYGGDYTKREVFAENVRSYLNGVSNKVITSEEDIGLFENGKLLKILSVDFSKIFG